MLSGNRIFILLSICMFITGLCNYNSTLNSLEYVVYGITCAIAFIHILTHGIFLHMKYALWLVIFIVLCSINAIISQYTVSILQFLIGTVITLIPFFYFIISYNYKFSKYEIIKYVDLLIIITITINIISLCETFIFKSADLIVGFVGTSIFWFQYLASINNHIIILCIAMYKITNKKKYIYYIAICAIYVILSIQLKTYIGLGVILIGYVLIYHKQNIVLNLIKIGALLSIIFVLLAQVPQIANKVIHYNDIYITDNQGIARAELYKTAVNLSINHLPLGSGQGTYGSIPANTYDSKVYRDYQLEYVWGLSKHDDSNFKMDTHWASILGENGILGTIIYLLIYTFPLYTIRKYKNRFKEYYFLITMCYIVISIESITLNLIARLPFIVIYSGLSGLILRQISNNYKSKIHD